MASVLITGTSRGIGFETALAFARMQSAFDMEAQPAD